jgi:glycosyltransferase A (GT-A) superfamily protein (DUF2064 family)
MVIGPSVDGGYYLIGLKQSHPQLFQGITWSIDTVFEETILRARKLGLTFSALQHWHDIDTVEDIQRLKLRLKKMPESKLIHTRKALASFDNLSSR